MGPEYPEIANTAYRLGRQDGHFVRRILFIIDKVIHEPIDFGRPEAGDLDIKVAFRQQNREFTQFGREHRPVPPRVRGNFIVGQS